MRTSIWSKTAATAVVAMTMLYGGVSEAKDFYKFGSIGGGTAAFVVNTGFAKVVNEKLPDVELQVTTGPGTRWLVQGAQYDMPIFQSSPVAIHFLANQLGPFKDIENGAELASHVRAILSYPSGLYQIVVYGDSGITDLDGLRGKQVWLGPPGGGATRQATSLVESHTGMKPDEDYQQVKMGYGAATQAFQDRKFDALIIHTSPPASAIEQIALTNEIRLLSLDPEKYSEPLMQQVLETPGMVRGTIGPDVYGKNQMNTDSVETVGSWLGIYTHDQMPDDLIYEMVKAFWESQDDIHALAAWMKDSIKLDLALNEIAAPLHPGARRYYEEVGLTIPESPK